jgi:hypothetical protein
MLEANIMMESLGEKPTKANKLKPFWAWPKEVLPARVHGNHKSLLIQEIEPLFQEDIHVDVFQQDIEYHT